jgi:hypothetical protein
MLNAVRARSRSFSLVALFAYIGVLTLLAFGHPCTEADGRGGQGECRSAGSAQHVPVVEHSSSGAGEHHACPACAFLQQAGSAIPVPAVTPALPAPVPTIGLPAVPHVRQASLVALPSRGPPTC